MALSKRGPITPRAKSWVATINEKAIALIGGFAAIGAAF